MQCQRCAKGFAEWQCKRCKKIVCNDCVQTTEDGVYCKDCMSAIQGQLPQTKSSTESQTTTQSTTNAAKKDGTDTFRSILITIIILDIGLGLIVLIGNYFTSQITIPNQPVISDLLGLFDTFGMNILYGMVGLTVVLFIMYVISVKFMK
jgi:hypothetical protein